MGLVAMLAAVAAGIVACSDSNGPKDGVSEEPEVCLDEDGNPLPLAAESDRVDLGEPSFSNPTDVTNPLLPIGMLARVLLLGTEDGEPLRVESTLLPYTKTIEWNDQEIEALVSQYVAFVDGRIHEVAIDWYAQADDGAVWYLGEDVFNYEDGVVADTDGTWIAGEDGPAGMIMGGSPQVGDVWRPENICGVVFEEVTVTEIDVTVDGPAGPVDGAVVVQELHQDGAYEDKTFAPGYGEFSTGAGSNLEAVALAVPTDALPDPTPAELLTISEGAEAVHDAAASEDWDAASSAADDMTAAWDAFRAGDVPPLLDAQMANALDALGAALDAQDPLEARQASVDVARASLDLELRHRPTAEIDVDLIALWVRQILIDTDADDLPAVLGDIAALRWTRDRLAGDGDPEVLARMDAQLRVLGAAARTRDLARATGAAMALRDALDGRRVATGVSP
jgi:hypothetical protein